MPSGVSITTTTRLLLVTLVATARLLSADDKTSDGGDYHSVPVSVGGKVVPIRVKEAADPYKNIAPSGIDYSSTSSLSHKSFALSDSSLSKSDSALTGRDQQVFVTKSYSDTSFHLDRSTPNLNTKINLTGSPGFDRGAAGFDKSYISSSNSEADKTSSLGQKSAQEQGRSAVLGGGKTDVFAADASLTRRSWSQTGFMGGPSESVDGDRSLTRMSGVPNRPLTIDEVRNLINHETKPDLDSPPEKASKPLNDPDYKPTPSAPPRNQEDEKDDPVPSPGTLAAPPENSEPLPAH